MHAQGVHEAIAILRSQLVPGDVALIKGYEDQGLSRIILALQGYPVSCSVTWCTTLHEQFCDDCPFLYQGNRGKGRTCASPATR